MPDTYVAKQCNQIETRKRCSHLRCKGQRAVFMIVVAAALTIPQAMPFRGVM